VDVEALREVLPDRIGGPVFRIGSVEFGEVVPEGPVGREAVPGRHAVLAVTYPVRCVLSSHCRPLLRFQSLFQRRFLTGSWRRSR